MAKLCMPSYIKIVPYIKKMTVFSMWYSTETKFATFAQVSRQAATKLIWRKLLKVSSKTRK